jgi:hypothetical protein
LLLLLLPPPPLALQRSLSRTGSTFLSLAVRAIAATAAAESIVIFKVAAARRSHPSLKQTRARHSVRAAAY